ncbi:hypothetical protein PHMEG_00012612 [Phytophthora megakarya]|uniref:Uncharacterized protein n=1 Tax=Phytophthora megakarya TaxID=4795 RepID=A0A225W8B0_9STRA|nr:hypothetical protein PHMEG_00012612 [Phytophthora megakarya]
MPPIFVQKPALHGNVRKAVSCDWCKCKSFEIEHLLTGKTRCAHASRLKPYADERFEVNEEILEHIANQDVYLAVEEFVAHRAHATHGFDGLGLVHIEDSWKLVTTMVEDVPVKFQEYVNSTNDGLLSQYVLNLQTRRKIDNHASSTSNRSQHSCPRTLSNTITSQSQQNHSNRRRCRVKKNRGD